MHSFIPPPMRSSEWWSTLAVAMNNPFGAAYEAYKGLSDRSWLAWANYETEFMAPAGGYPVIFATVTDLLLWFRWIVLYETLDSEEFQAGRPISRRDLTLDGDARRLADHIDAAPDGAGAEYWLALLSDDMLHRYWGEGEFVIYTTRSIHEYLSALAPPETWQEHYDPAITYADRLWSMPDATWLRMREDLDCHDTIILPGLWD